MKFKLFTFQFLLLFFLFGNALKLSAQNGWSSMLNGVGSFSSPRVTDLNGDGIQDIVMGAGRLEFQACDSAVIAINGQDGTLLWNVSASDQIFGSAIFQDVTGDNVDDAFIGGRSAELIGINGATGEEIWRFKEVNNTIDANWFNFYNGQWIADQDNDGYLDILISNGGDVMIKPYDENRPAGYLLIISSNTGKLISQALMPDGKEIYMSPVVLNSESNESSEVVFGTGGETVGGNLFVATIADVRNEDLSNAILLDSCATKGYIGPPVRVDINGDEKLDIVTSSVDGRMLCFDGDTKELLWNVLVPNTESYSSIAIGNFTTDDTPDFFVSYGQGIWPNLDWSFQVMVDGRNGKVKFQDSLGYYQNSTPLVFDLNNDGLDEVLMSLNFQEINEFEQKYFYNTLIATEFENFETVNLANNFEGSNLSSTPWIGDLDGNGFLDIIYCHGTNIRHTYTFDQMKIIRIDTQIPIKKKVKWGAYQGSGYDGIYRK